MICISKPHLKDLKPKLPLQPDNVDPNDLPILADDEYYDDYYDDDYTERKLRHIPFEPSEEFSTEKPKKFQNLRFNSISSKEFVSQKLEEFQKLQLNSIPSDNILTEKPKKFQRLHFNPIKVQLYKKNYYHSSP